MDFYLGLTGLPGAGKDAVAKLLAAELAAHGIGTLHYSLSGPIAVELQRRGLPPDREQYRAVANEVRANLGNGAWAARIAREIHETLAAGEWADVFVLIDGVRNPAEVAVFKQLWGHRFHLLAVNAPEVVRRQNLAARSSPKDAAVLHHLAAPDSGGADGAGAGNPGADNPALAPVLMAEMGIGQPQHGTNVLACLELADWTLENTEHDAAMRSLRAGVGDLAARRVLPLYRQGAPAADAPGSDGSSGGSSGGVSSVRERPRALVVESDPIWQAQLALLLQQEGCAVEFAADYAEASRKLLAQPLRHPYQLLTVDLHLPGAAPKGEQSCADSADSAGAGFDLLQSLHYFDRSLPSIVVTTGAEAAQVSRAFRDFGVRDCFAKQDFAAPAFRSRVRSLLQTPFYVVATLQTGAVDYLLVNQPCTLSLRIQRDAPLHRPPRGGVRSLLRPCTTADWPVAVVATSPDLRIAWQPPSPQQLLVPANYLAQPLVYTLTPLTAGNGQLELEFHQPGQFVEWLALDVSVHAE